MARERKELFVRAEKFLNENPDKTLSDFRKLEKITNPNVPLLKTRQKKGQPIRVTHKGRSSIAESTRKLQIEKNRPTQAVFDEAGKLWDELVGKRGKFTMGDQTFNNKQEYQEFEANRHDAITKSKEKLNRLGGNTHGHAVPPKHKFAVETYMQSFPEDASGNYSSQDKVPKDFSKRLDKADIPKTKIEVAKRHVGTSDRITNPIADSIKEKLIKFFKLNGNGNTNGGLKINNGGAVALERTSPNTTNNLKNLGISTLMAGNQYTNALQLLNTLTKLTTGKSVSERVNSNVRDMYLNPYHGHNTQLRIKNKAKETKARNEKILQALKPKQNGTGKKRLYRIAEIS